LNIIIKYPKVAQNSILFFPPTKNISSLMHWSCPDHLVALNVITQSIFGEEHKLCISWCCGFMFVAFQILCVKDLSRIHISSDFQSFTAECYHIC